MATITNKKKVDITRAVLPAMMVRILSENSPALAKLYDDVSQAAKLGEDAKAAGKARDEALEEGGYKAESLFSQAKNAAVELAAIDNGPGQPKGVAGATVVDYFAARVAAEGRPAETGRKMASLTGQMVEALNQNLTEPETLLAWTRPEAQDFFASEDAQTRKRVKDRVNALVKGANAEYCSQLLEWIEGFEYSRPEDAKPGTVEYTGKYPVKAKKDATPAVAPTVPAEPAKLEIAA